MEIDATDIVPYKPKMDPELEGTPGLTPAAQRSYPVPGPGAIRALQEQGAKFAADFDIKFGPGSSNKYLPGVTTFDEDGEGWSPPEVK